MATSIIKKAALPVTELTGIGPKAAARLEKMGITTIHDLLFHFPSRYEDRSRVSGISQAQYERSSTLLCTVVSSKIQQGRKRVLNVTVKDDTGVMTLVFFRFGKFQERQLKAGVKLRLFGSVKPSTFGPQMSHPEYRVVKNLDPKQAVENNFYAVYPLTDGVRADAMKSYVRKAFDYVKNCTDEPLRFRDDLPAGVTGFLSALRFIHRPPRTAALSLLHESRHPVQIALIREELLAYNLSLVKIRAKSDGNQSRIINARGDLRSLFLESLPFKPTGAQQRVTDEIDRDLSADKPMMRLVQGDVGSGKTLVAAMAAMSVIESGGQVALLAPTEILAEQHAETFNDWLAPLGVRVTWLAGRMGKKAKETVLRRTAEGQIDLLIGTHAIFQKDVMFKQLDLMIVDEQHRFGVHQRLALREKSQDGVFPHQLVMTATPIPRTLAMVAYADLDTSIIDELPPGRTPVKTVAIPEQRREEVIERIRNACQKEGRQVYWVCTLIEESEVLECQAASETHRQLQQQLKDLNVGLVHGRMRSEEKQTIMDAFKSGKLDVLVATTVIEVGVNVPNASLMIIENPERLGLAQLHQLRGRVGRGDIASSCVLLYKQPLTKVASERLSVLRASNDGFVVAQKDLELRGPGELLGIKQTGLARMKLADLSRDDMFVDAANKEAQKILLDDPGSVDSYLERWRLDVNMYGNV